MTDTEVRNPTPLDKQQPADDDQRLWSVTTIIGALDKPALVYWSAEQTAIAAMANAKALTEMTEEDGVDFLKGARYRKPPGQTRTNAELGTYVHELCEQYAITGTRPDVDPDDEAVAFLEQFDRWAQDFSPSYEAAEVTVYNPEMGYAGTCDGFLTVDGVRFIIDYKTSRKSFDKKGKPTGPYPEVALQLAAYRYATHAAVFTPRRMEKFRRRYYLLSPSEADQAVAVPEVDTGAVIHITPEHCEMYPVDCGDDVYRSFLFVQEAAKWHFQDSKHVIGDPMVAPEKG